MLPESGPFSDILQKAKWTPTSASVAKIMWPGLWRTIQQLGHSETLYDIFEYDDASGALWRVREESLTLKEHFPAQENNTACPVVPLTSMITLLAVKNKQISFRGSLREPLLPGDIIRTMPNGIQLIKKDGTEGPMILEILEWQPKDNELSKNTQIPPDIHLTKQQIELPQGENFQFVTAARTSEWHQFFSWIYRLPSAFENPHVYKIPPFDIGLLPEIVAQIGAAVGKNLLPDWYIFVYEWWVFNFDDNIDLIEAESLRIAAQLTRNEDGKISYLFCLRRSRDDKPVLWWQVDAASIEYTRLLKLTEILKKRRTKGK